MEQKELQELFRLIRLEFYWVREEGKLGLLRLKDEGLIKDEMDYHFALDQAIQKLEHSILPDLRTLFKKIEKVVEEKDQ
jgi:hypothetical protein